MIKVNITGYKEGGFIFQYLQNWTFIVGAGENPSYVDTMVLNMKRGEKALFVIQPQYAEGFFFFFILNS